MGTVRFLAEDPPPDRDARERVTTISDLSGVETVVPFTDVTRTQQEGTGSTAVATRDVLYPELTSEVMNCGFALIATDLQAEALTDEFISTFCTTLNECLPAFEPDRDDALGMLTDGAEHVVEEWDCSPTVLDHIENGGSMFAPDERPENVSEFVPAWLLRHPGTYRETPISHLRGNHFIEFQRIDEILDDATAAEWGLSENQIVIFLHGDYLLTYYLFMHYTNRKKFRETSSTATKAKLTLSKGLFHLLYRDLRDLPRQWQRYTDEALFTPFEQESPEGQLFASAMYMGMNFAYANRLLWTLALRETLDRTCGGDAELLWDVGHDTIQQEQFGEETYWIHRKAAGNAVPEKPALITGSYNMNSFLGKGVSGSEYYLRSYDHGCQRVIDHFDANGSLTEGKGTTRRYDQSGALQDEVNHIDTLPIETVVNNLTTNDVISSVAWLSPVVNIAE